MEPEKRVEARIKKFSSMGVVHTQANASAE
jgi:hypothetical protein